VNIASKDNLLSIIYFSAAISIQELKQYGTTRTVNQRGYKGLCAVEQQTYVPNTLRTVNQRGYKGLCAVVQQTYVPNTLLQRF